MKYARNSSALYYALLCIMLTIITGCVKNTEKTNTEKEIDSLLSITVRNVTSKPLYATCFAYMKKDSASRWRWHKTPVYELTSAENIYMPIGVMKNQQDRDFAFGILGLFTEKQEAENAIYELLPDRNKIELDKLAPLKDQVVVIGVEKYGISGHIFDFDFVPQNDTREQVPELDFTVINSTDNTVHVAGFIYQRKEDMPVWRYDKTPLITLKPGESGLIDVDTLTDPYDRKYMRGTLAVFDESEREAAEKANFQLLEAHHKIKLGLLSALKDHRVTIHNKKYGILGTRVDFSIAPETSQPGKTIDFKKMGAERLKYEFGD